MRLIVLRFGSAEKQKSKKKPNTEEQSVPAHEILPEPRPLAMPTDSQWLTPLYCFVREKIVEVFTATQKDVDDLA